eukprot:2076230-Prymnesium_polylepis.1
MRVHVGLEHIDMRPAQIELPDLIHAAPRHKVPRAAPPAASGSKAPVRVDARKLVAREGPRVPPAFGQRELARDVLQAEALPDYPAHVVRRAAAFEPLVGGVGDAVAHPLRPLSTSAASISEGEDTSSVRRRMPVTPSAATPRL